MLRRPALRDKTSPHLSILSIHRNGQILPFIQKFVDILDNVRGLFFVIVVVVVIQSAYALSLT
jgi:hypothetical protein